MQMLLEIQLIEIRFQSVRQRFTISIKVPILFKAKSLSEIIMLH
jgi:hypothetical protein